MAYGVAFGLPTMKMSEIALARRCLTSGTRTDITSRDFAMGIEFDKLIEIASYLETQGEILGYYIPEIFGTVAYIPVDRTFHNVIHTVWDLTQELIDTHESANLGSVSESTSGGLLCR